ncbi:hypothetical protein SLEP1_g16497 [Rubroshorea leprosula]|uniref:DUF7356 domain-containing protein n=1 Tax=Rubroshorea leprosula TaxID=152421 RepID=A0AAV5IX19_9ROSI|nr:hypothetical protein SLEP1_g16497 [Rubroshorea leprosula]
MDRNGIAAVFFLFLIFFDVSNASFIWKLRKLGDKGLKNSSGAKEGVSPSPSPEVSNATGYALPPTDTGKASGERDSGSPPPKSLPGSGNKDEEEQTTDNGDKNDSQPGPSETCEGVSKMCKDNNSLTVCIKSSEIGSKELVLLFKNEGNETLKVHPVPSNSVKYPFEELDIPKHENKTSNITVAFNQRVNLTFDAGHGNCVIQVDPLDPKKGVFHLPSYDQLVTPVNGAYFLIAAILIFVVTWTCCKFKKRRRQLDGIPYQELEMGRPESMSAATGVETAEGWDQGWDDDWDEENAVKPPAGHHLGNISANGLTARSPNKDGWENDWDD